MVDACLRSYKVMRISNFSAAGSTICTTPCPGFTSSRRRRRPNFLSLFTSLVTEPRLRPSSSASAEMLIRFFRTTWQSRMRCAVRHSIMSSGSAKVKILSASTRSPFDIFSARSKERRICPSSPSQKILVFIASPEGLCFSIEEAHCFQIPGKGNQRHFAHVMALMGTVCVIEAQHADVVGAEQMGQEEGKVVSNGLTLRVDPDLLAKNDDPTCTPKTSLVVNFLAK